MNTLELKPGDTIGVFFYDDKRGTKAIIEEVDKVSPTGIVTLKSGTRYTSKGTEIGALGDPTYLCRGFCSNRTETYAKALCLTGKRL